MSIAEKLQTIAENQERVFEAGKKSQNQAFWDSFTKTQINTSGAYKERTNYANAFSAWGGDIFFPTNVNITVESRQYMFQWFNQNKELVDLTERLEQCNSSIDFSKCDVFSYTFANAWFSRLPVIDTTSASAMAYLFQNCPVSIVEKIILKNDGSQTFASAFSGCSNLKEIRFDGIIGNTISFASSSLLSNDSVNSIINALMTITDGVARTIIFHANVKAQDWFTDELKAIITDTKRWTLA